MVDDSKGEKGNAKMAMRFHSFLTGHGTSSKPKEEKPMVFRSFEELKFLKEKNLGNLSVTGRERQILRDALDLTQGRKRVIDDSALETTREISNLGKLVDSAKTYEKYLGWDGGITNVTQTAAEHGVDASKLVQLKYLQELVGMPFRNLLNDAVLIKAQNVRDYFDRHYEEHNWMQLTSFSAARPPFEHVVISFDDRPLPYMELGHIDVLISSSNKLTTFMDFCGKLDDGEEGAFKISNDASLFLRILVYKDTAPFAGYMLLFLDKMGQVLPVSDSDEGKSYLWVHSEADKSLLKEFGLPLERYLDVYGREVCIALATVQFMNCKNVEIIDNPPSRQQRRAAERKGEPRPVTYKTLRIVPFGRVARQQDRKAQAMGAEMSLHICRGHFKDYRQGKGLGKWHRRGVWWWSPQVRGKVSSGRVVKDYEVGAPKS